MNDVGSRSIRLLVKTLREGFIHRKYSRCICFTPNRLEWIRLLVALKMVQVKLRSGMDVLGIFKRSQRTAEQFKSRCSKWNSRPEVMDLLSWTAYERMSDRRAAENERRLNVEIIFLARHKRWRAFLVEKISIYLNSIQWSCYIQFLLVAKIA